MYAFADKLYRWWVLVGFNEGGLADHVLAEELGDRWCENANDFQTMANKCHEKCCIGVFKQSPITFCMISLCKWDGKVSVINT